MPQRPATTPEFEPAAPPPRPYEPGAALAAVGVVFAILGVWYFYLTFAAIALGAMALDRSSGRRGGWAIGLGALVFIGSVALAQFAGAVRR